MMHVLCCVACNFRPSHVPCNLEFLPYSYFLKIAAQNQAQMGSQDYKLPLYIALYLWFNEKRSCTPNTVQSKEYGADKFQ